MNRTTASWLIFIVAFGVFASFNLQLSSLIDSDSYFHLAVAREYLESGLTDQLSWARFSILHDGFGDKEILFHALIAPLTAGFDAESSTAGRVAIALFAALLAATLAYFGHRAVGVWGLLVPLLIMLGSRVYFLRTMRLRPEVLGAVLLLLAAWLAGRQRYRALAVVAFVYTLSYTAFHALLGLCGLWFLHHLWRHGEAHWRLVLYPVLGTAIGLLVHPHFPHNLLVWKIQSVDFFLWKGVLDVGIEIASPPASALLLDNIPWLIALFVFWLSRSTGRRRHELDGPADTFLVAAVVFGVMTLLAGRFVIYALPFMTLALLFAVGRDGGLDRWTRLPWRGRLPVSLTLGVAAVLALLFGTLGMWQSLRMTPPDRETAARDLGAVLPEGARVAAEWRGVNHFVYFAPQAHYLNVLDPVFMVIPYPERYWLQRRMFEGEVPDVALATRGALESDHLLISRALDRERLARRLRGDPRWQGRMTSYEELWTLAGDNEAFVLDWTDMSTGQPYPRVESPLDRIEGFVDATRLGPGCRVLAHRFVLPEARPVAWELAAWGPTRVALDRERVLTVQGAKAVLGEGVVFDRWLEAGEHEIRIETCSVDGVSGFYLLERPE